MTGHQPTPGTSSNIDGHKNPGAIDLIALLKACGVDPLVQVNMSSIHQMRRVILEMIKKKGFSCVVVKKECKLQEKRRSLDEKWKSHYVIVQDRCRKCNRCFSVLSCPAISKNSDDEIVIDPHICTGCSACYQVCPNKAIVNIREEVLHKKENDDDKVRIDSAVSKSGSTEDESCSDKND
jgi:indolepyruvate ferredoxin oxidoreductase alpha subunit